jgi:hypothetical protein
VCAAGVVDAAGDGEALWLTWEVERDDNDEWAQCNEARVGAGDVSGRCDDVNACN